jgi:hypothetical protein
MSMEALAPPRPSWPKAKRVDPDEWIQSWIRGGDACRLIQPFQVQPGQTFVISSRVSSHEQAKAGNLKSQRKLVDEVESRGGIVLQVFEHEWSGHGPEWDQRLREMANYARRHNAVLLAFCTDRLIRNPGYRSNHELWCQAQATDSDLRYLEIAVGNVRVMTYLHPNTPPKVCRSMRIRWGQEAKGNKGGRPRTKPRGYCKERLKRFTDLAQQLRREGWSLRAIAATISKKSGYQITHSGIKKWL